jgi:hypothetical protein
MTEEDHRGARYSDLFENAHNHTPDCAYCPICATIAAVRTTKPEVLEHLAAAARELVLAAGLFLENASEVIGEQKSSEADDGDDGKVRRIEVI